VSTNLGAHQTTKFEITALGFEIECFLYVQNGVTIFMNDTDYAKGGHISPKADGYNY